MKDSETLFTLMIVEDEKDLRDLLIEEFSDNPQYRVLSAENGAEGLEKIKASNTNNPIHAVLSDINMPKLNGLDFLEAARSLGVNTPFVFLTGYGDKEKAVRALRLGAFDFLAKPYDRNELFSTVARALEYGFKLIEIETQLDDLFKKSGLPEGKKELFKQSQRALLKMRADISTLQNSSQSKKAA